MKFLKVGFGLALFSVVLVICSSPFSACTKTQTQIVHDTIVRKDTITIIDSSSCNRSLMDGLVAWYNFNNGTLKDSSGNNNHIIFNNATATADRFGKANNAYLFDGSNSYMKVANSTSLNFTNSITLMAIVKIKGYYAGNCNANQIFGKGYNDFINGFYVLRFGSIAGCGNPVDTTKELFSGDFGDYNSRTGVGQVNSASNYIQSNFWYNIIYTDDNGLSKIYINGVLANTFTAASTFTPNAQELYIGKHGDPQYPYWFNGIIDELRIYNRALCQDEVTRLNSLKQ